MSILKRLKKKQQQKITKDDIKKAAQTISNINKLIEMKLLQVDLSTRKFSIQTALFAGKDLTHKSNVCRSVALYWDAMTGQSSKEEAFSVYDIDTDKQFASFLFTIGFLDYYSEEQRAGLDGLTGIVESAVPYIKIV